jgi:hypothetical protein
MALAIAGFAVATEISDAGGGTGEGTILKFEKKAAPRQSKNIEIDPTQTKIFFIFQTPA